MGPPTVLAGTLLLFIYWRLIAQHRVISGLFTSSSLTRCIQYKTCTLYTKVKHINIIRKLVLSVLLSSKKWQIKLGDADTIDRFGLAFQYQIKQIIKKRMDKNNCKLKILYKCMKANTSPIYGSISCAYHQLKNLLTAQQQQKTKSHTEEPTFRKMEVEGEKKEVRRMGQKQKRIR